MSNLAFRGTYTALITPFATDGSVDYDALERLIGQQVAAGIEGLIILGTTGESPTISHEESQEILQRSVQAANGQLQIVAGVGSNSTEKTVAAAKEAAAIGVDGLLVVNPYYNKPSQEGLYQHFKASAEATDVPVILYNIAGRTGVNLSTDTLLRLVDLPTIVAVKEASGDLGQMMDVIDQTPDNFAVLSGDDNMTYPLITVGGHGVISVISNLLPAKTKEMVDAALAGDYDRARALHYELLPVMRACFMETNPLPIKTALALRGDVQEEFRLPLCKMEAGNKEKLRAILSEHSLI